MNGLGHMNKLGYMSQLKNVRSRGACILAAGLALLLDARAVHAIPAFARKYNLRCTACHEAWPKLNDFGRAFRDNGYQMMEGTDAPNWYEPAYWPVSLRITPSYQYNSVTNVSTDKGPFNVNTGSVTQVGMDLLTAGVLMPDVSFLVVATGFTENEATTLESAWVRFDNLFGSSWANLKLGVHEIDLPRSAHRPWNLSETGYLIYSYHPKNSASSYDMGENQPGIEWEGHDHGSFNRAAFSVFNVKDANGSTAFSTPGFYGHLTHEELFDSPFISAAKVGAFGVYATFPTSTLTSDGEPVPGTGGNLEPTMKFGGEVEAWLGPAATPLDLILVGAWGQDNQDLIPDASRNGTFAGGFLEVGYTPFLKTTFFGRWDIIRNLRQAVPDTPRSTNDETAYTIGARYTLGFSTRAAVALHVEYSTEMIVAGGDNGADTRLSTVFLGVDFAL